MKYVTIYEIENDGPRDCEVAAVAVTVAVCAAGLALILAGLLVYLACLRWPWLVPLLTGIGCALFALAIARSMFDVEEISESGPVHTDGGAGADSGHGRAAAAGSAGPGASTPECAVPAP